MIPACSSAVRSITGVVSDIHAQASFRFQFGEGSCRKHFREALRAGLVPRLYLNKRIAFDIDTSADLRLWLQRYRTIG